MSSVGDVSERGASHWKLQWATEVDLPVVDKLHSRHGYRIGNSIYHGGLGWWKWILEVGKILLLVHRKSLVGTVAIMPIPLREGEGYQIGALLVRKSYRGRGCASLLLGVAQQMGREWGRIPLPPRPQSVYCVPLCPVWSSLVGLGACVAPVETGIAIQSSRPADSTFILKALGTVFSTLPDSDQTPQTNPTFYSHYLCSRKDVISTFVRREGTVVTDMVCVSHQYSREMTDGVDYPISVLQYHYCTSLSLGNMLDTVCYHLYRRGFVALLFPEWEHHAQVRMTGLTLCLESGVLHLPITGHLGLY